MGRSCLGGNPQGPAASKNANPNNNVGWAWCIEPGYGVPYETTFVYDRAKAEKLNVNRQYRDAAIILARKIESAVLDKDYEAASTYRTYLIPFVARDETSKHRAATTITGEDPTYTNKYGKRNFPGYKGSYEEFKKLTGYEFVKHELYGYKTDLKKIPGATIPAQPADWFITIVRPKPDDKYDKRTSQTVMPVDQPGLPNENGGSGSNPSTKKPKISTTVDQLGEHEALKAGTVVTDHVHYEGLVPNKEYILNAELRNKTDESVIGESKEPVKFTPKSSEGDVDVKITVNEGVEAGSVDQGVAFEYLTSTAVDKSGKDSESGDENKIAEHTDINDGKQTVDSHEELKPKISTTVDQLGEHEALKAGTVVTDHVHYEGLVPNKEYTSKAELISKKDGESVLGTGEKTFTPKKSKGMEPVTITVNDDVKEPVQAAVAFEELTSVEVNDKGEETPGTTSEKPNHIADHKDINDEDQTVTSEEGPKVSTNADFEGDLREVVAGAKVVDQVSYEGLVPGKEYTLDAQLISKEDGKTVLGETKGHKFTPDEANGTEAVTIVVDDSVTEPVEAAVAFETLTSTQVDKHGEDNPTDEDNPNPVGEHKDINDDAQTVTSNEDGGDTPNNGGSSKSETPWWLILIPGIGLGKIIKDHFDEVGHQEENPNDSHGGKGHQPNHQDAPEGDNSGHDNGSGDTAGQEPGEVGNALPADAPRADIKSVPSGATELEPGMQSYIK